MWFVLNGSEIIARRGSLLPAVSDIPTNMEFISHSNSTVEFKFFYSTSGDEKTDTVVLNSATCQRGKYSQRVFVLQARNVAKAKQGLRELILSTSKARNELSYRSCLNAIEKHENEFIKGSKPAILEISPGKKLEKVLDMFEPNVLEEIYAFLETTKALKFSNVEQLLVILDMYMEKRK